ncbi:unnamed protein product [Symbiodinium sp. CCMP2456]|nr:unnamed protein product [Symbiodinium sp. CCMP2456]
MLPVSPAACLGAHRESCCFHFRHSPPAVYIGEGRMGRGRHARAVVAVIELVALKNSSARCVTWLVSFDVRALLDYRQGRRFSPAATPDSALSLSRIVGVPSGVSVANHPAKRGLPLKKDPRSAVLFHIEVESGDAVTKPRSYSEHASQIFADLPRPTPRLLGVYCPHLCHWQQEVFRALMTAGAHGSRGCSQAASAQFVSAAVPGRSGG